VTIELRQLGSSELRVSAIALGTMQFGGTGMFEQAGRVDVASARRQLDIAMDAGVNLIDTANVYSSGASEEVIGRIIAGRRDRVVLATKVGLRVGPDDGDVGLSAAHITRECERSLRRLRTDHIDLYQTHVWDGLTPIEETLEAFDRLVRAGKVRYVGCSNYSAWHLMKTLAVSDRTALPRLVSQQLHYTLLAREAEHELLPASIDQRVGVLVWSPLAGGLLTGKYTRTRHPDDARTWPLPPVDDSERLYAIVDALLEVARAHDTGAAEVALAWLMRRPGVTSVIIGARSESQLRANLAAATLTLTEGEHARLDQATDSQLPYPFWHQARTIGSRLSAADLALLGSRLDTT
jgi:aryl-alcohol dehydrogenase-like predicted oxidoreductase